MAKNFTEHYTLLSLQSSNRPGSAASSEGKQSKNVSFDEDVTVFEDEKDEVPEEEQTQNHEESDEEENKDEIDAQETVRSPEPDDSSSSSSSSSSESESSDSEDEEKSGRKGTDHFPKISKVHLKLYMDMRSFCAQSWNSI